VLCFIEVKTRTTRDVKPAEAAVDRKKRHDLRAVIRDYLKTLPRRQYPESPAWRFDVITVYYDKATLGSSDHRAATATFELFQNAALSS
jgi:putative endonuclease